MAAGFRAVVSAASTPNRSLLRVRRFETSWRHDACRRCRRRRQNRSRRRGFLLDVISCIDQSWRPYSRLLSIQQSTHVQGNRLEPLTLEIVIINNVYKLVQGTTRQRIIEPDVRRLRWPCRQCRASAATTTAHKFSMCLPSQPACLVCHAGHVWGLGS
jgi:hypothetical protein